MGLKFDLIKYLNTNFSISGGPIFLKISGIVGGRHSIDIQSYGKFLSQGKFQGQIFANLVGGTKLPGVQKLYEGVCDVDREPRDLSNGEKNLALCLPYLEFN